MLNVNNLVVHYGDSLALSGVSFSVEKGRIVAMLGSNGSGKTTLLKSVASLLKPSSGSVVFMDKDITAIGAHYVVRHGIALVPEGKHIFGRMSVAENLLLGAITKKDAAYREERLESIYGLFPRLRERLGQLAGTLSGGEQQMLAIGRALMSDPQLLMLDEPSLGIAPKLVEKIFEAILTIRDRGMTILLVEQHVQESLECADYAYILQTGRLILQGPTTELMENDDVKRAYLGM